MKVALVHDYIKEFGGAERVLRALADMYPDAPIYTAFRVKGSTCDREFKDRRILESIFAPLIKYGNLYSPLRFLIPLIWKSFDLSDYDLVITSCSSYFARGFRVGPKTKVLAYCHTPPRFLYGYEMSINLQRFWIVRVYATIVNHFLRLFDLHAAQTVDKWLVNSRNVQKRVTKFYRKESEIVYPPVEVSEIGLKSKGVKKESFYLIVSRLVGAKGIPEAAQAADKMGIKIKVVGEAVGFSNVKKQLQRFKNVELLGRIDDDKLWKLYPKAKGFIALARDEDFGVTPVEAQAAGTPVIAFNGGGFRESVIDGITGVLIDDTNVDTIEKAIKRFEKIQWKKTDMINQAKKFSKERFKTEIQVVVAKMMKDEK